MKFCYQVATPDVIFSPNITAYQGPVEESFSALADLGYDGVELMTLPREYKLAGHQPSRFPKGFGCSAGM